MLLDTHTNKLPELTPAGVEMVTRLKRNSWTLSRKYSSFDQKRAGRVAKCGMHTIELEWVASGRKRTLMSFLCQDRFCEICARKRSAKLARRYHEIIRENCEGLHGHLLTLTYKNSETLRERSRIAKDVRNLLRRSLWKRYGGIVGGLYSVEVTKGEGGWHPHVHMLVFTRLPVASYRDGKWLVELNQEVSNEWLAITRDSFVVRGVSWNGNVQEVVKYMTKSPESLPVDELRELTSWARGMRSVSAFGLLYGKQVPEEIEEEEVNEGGMVMARWKTFVPRVWDFVVQKNVLIELHQGATMREIFPLVIGGTLEAKRTLVVRRR